MTLPTDREHDVLRKVARAGIWQASRELKSLARKMGRKGWMRSEGAGNGGVAKYSLTPDGADVLRRATMASDGETVRKTAFQAEGCDPPQWHGPTGE